MLFVAIWFIFGETVVPFYLLATVVWQMWRTRSLTLTDGWVLTEVMISYSYPTLTRYFIASRVWLALLDAGFTMGPIIADLLRVLRNNIQPP